jgi:hypothetical protein
VELNRNYRSTETILYAAQSLIRNSPNRMKEGFMKALSEGGAPIRVYHLKTSDEEARVVTRIVKGLRDEGYRFGDIAILYRTHQIAEAVEHALLREGIPVQRVQPKPYWQSDLRPLYALLRLVAHPDALAANEAVNFPQVILDDLTAVRAGNLVSPEPAALEGFPPLTRYNLQMFWDGILRLREQAERGTEFVLGGMLAWVRERFPPWKESEVSGVSIGGILAEHNARVKDAAEMLAEAIRKSYIPKIRESEGIGGSAARALLKSALPAFLRGETGAGKAASLPPLNALEALTALHAALVSTEKVGEGEFVVYDVETTGNDPRRDQIVEIGAIKLRNRKEVGRFHSFVKPTRPISVAAQSVHHISWKELESAPSIQEVLPRFLKFVGGAPVVGHNIREFDNAILDRELWKMQNRGFNHPSVDTLALARHLWPEEPSH